MVTLRNIKKDNEYISADYYPCGIDDVGYAKIRISDGEVVNRIDAGVGAPTHAIDALRRLAKKGIDDFPNELTIMWY